MHLFSVQLRAMLSTASIDLSADMCAYCTAFVRACVACAAQVEWVQCHDVLAGTTLPPEEQAVYM
jgi:hypothetical protein